MIEEGVTNIALSIFDECAATSISIPSTTDELDGWWSSTGYWYERNLFEGCEMLQEILVDPRNAAFTSVDGVLFSKDMTNLLSYPRGRISSSYTIPSGVTHIGNHSFALCDNLSNVVIPNSVTEIGTYAFYMCHGLTTLNLPDSITSIGNDAFHECNRITNLKISDGLTRLVSNVFASCSGLTSVEIPSSVTTIDHTALVGCKNMVSLYIPSSVVFIENGGFLAGCDSLKDIFYGGNQDQWLAIKGPTGNPSVTVPSVELYTTENGQYYIVSENPDRLAEIHYNSTGGGQGGSGEDPDPMLETKNISGELRSGSGCRVLWQCSYQVGEDGQPQNANVKIFTSSTDTVPEELFLYNESAENGLPFPWELEPYNIPRSAVTTLSIQGEPAKQLHIPSRAFQGYDHLGQAVLNGVSGIDSYAFEGCAALQSVGFSSDTLKSIGASAFANCSALGTIKLDRSVVAIGDGAFSGCASVKIRCCAGSVAHQYAVENNIPFELIIEHDSVVHDFEYGRDTFQFANTGLDFFGLWGDMELWWKNDRTITGDYYDILFDGLEEDERQRTKDYMKKSWDGSCFGMSCVLSLVWAGNLDIGFFQGNARYLHDLFYPKDSETTFNLINYYHLMQMTNRTAFARMGYNKEDETSNNRAIIEALDRSAYPVVVGFDKYPLNGTPSGHAVVAYGYKRSGGDYLVSIWDPNDKNTPNTLRISNDFTTSTFAHQYDTNDVTSYIKYTLTVEDSEYDYRNIQEKLMEKGHSSM